MTDPTIVYAAVLATLYGAHSFADHWVQTNCQAVRKGTGGAAGALASLRHVLTYTATLALALVLVAWRTGLDVDPVRVGIALAINGATHWLFDLRWPIQRAARRLGKGGWLDADGGAHYQLDQSAHLGMLVITALIAV